MVGVFCQSYPAEETKARHVTPADGVADLTEGTTVSGEEVAGVERIVHAEEAPEALVRERRKQFE